MRFLADPHGIHANRDRAVEQALHHGMRLRDDADAPAVFVDQAGNHLRGRVGLAGPGGPCTATYDESRSSSAAAMSVAVSPLCGSGAPRRVRGGRRSRMSKSAVLGSCGSPPATSVAVASIDSRSLAVGGGGPG
ncbi:hypothetical protein I553_9556 [Mycobacterium xenopi 4042]|uniref:Uncharacterized protein n=1 Tax=Mycobacterium xenopi 4042 TaxID=1299334 RepID=X8E0Q1_MYCXE|nr:hypothetical protein I553_9556 [Mycobacterium xenopi 4042]